MRRKRKASKAILGEWTNLKLLEILKESIALKETAPKTFLKIGFISSDILRNGEAELTQRVTWGMKDYQ